MHEKNIQHKCYHCFHRHCLPARLSTGVTSCAQKNDTVNAPKKMQTAYKLLFNLSRYGLYGVYKQAPPQHLNRYRNIQYSCIEHANKQLRQVLSHHAHRRSSATRNLLRSDTYLFQEMINPNFYNTFGKKASFCASK